MELMQEQSVVVNGKTRRSVIIRGQPYLRKGYDLPVPIAETFEKKCDLLGEDESKVVEKLVIAFTEVTGWGENWQRPPGYEKRAGYHIRDAVTKTKRGMFPWRMFSKN